MPCLLAVRSHAFPLVAVRGGRSRRRGAGHRGDGRLLCFQLSRVSTDFARNRADGACGVKLKLLDGRVFTFLAWVQARIIGLLIRAHISPRGLLTHRR